MNTYTLTNHHQHVLHNIHQILLHYILYTLYGKLCEIDRRNYIIQMNFKIDFYISNLIDGIKKIFHNFVKFIKNLKLSFKSKSLNMNEERRSFSGKSIMM